MTGSEKAQSMAIKTAAHVAKEFVACEVKMLGLLVSVGTWSTSASGLCKTCIHVKKQNM